MKRIRHKPKIYVNILNGSVKVISHNGQCRTVDILNDSSRHEKREENLVTIMKVISKLKQQRDWISATRRRLVEYRIKTFMSEYQ